MSSQSVIISQSHKTRNKTKPKLNQQLLPLPLSLKKKI